MIPSRVAIFLPSLCGGGAERVMLTLANALATRGFLVDLVLVKAEGPYLSGVLPSVRVINLNKSRMALSLFALARYLRQNHPDAMLSAMTHSNIVAILAKFLARVSTRLVVSEHCNFSWTLHTASYILSCVMLWLVKLCYPKADAVVSVSIGVAEDLARHVSLDQGVSHVIYNPIVNETLLGKAWEPIDIPMVIKGDVPVILGCGRLTEQKNFPVLLSAFKIIRESMPCRLIIIGEGELRPMLTELIASLGITQDVSLPGFVENPFAWMRWADVFVLSSSFEGLPTVLIEAMACGTRVVSTDCPFGPSEILEGGRWGRLVPVNDATTLAQAILDTLDDCSPPDVQERAAFFSEGNSVDAFLRVMGFAKT